jgi:biopolymer transport protein ExbD
MLYQIFDYKCTSLLSEYPTIEANSPSKAIRQYLKDNNRNENVKVSGDKDVHYGVFACIVESGRIYQLRNKKAMWFKIVS